MYYLKEVNGLYMIFASDWNGQGLFQSLNKTKFNSVCWDHEWHYAYTYYVPATVYNRHRNELSYLITTHVRWLGDYRSIGQPLTQHIVLLQI